MIGNEDKECSVQVENAALRAQVASMIDCWMRHERIQRNGTLGVNISDVLADNERLQNERAKYAAGWRDATTELTGARELIGEMIDALSDARRWSAAWKTAAKDHRQGRNLAASLFAKYLMQLVRCQTEVERLTLELASVRSVYKAELAGEELTDLGISYREVAEALGFEATLKGEGKNA